MTPFGELRGRARHTARAATALAMFLALVAASDLSAITARWAPPLFWQNSGQPFPPPPSWATPALLSRFFTLYVAYQHLPVDGKPSFSVWLVMCGVTEPHQHTLLMALYLWYAVPAEAV